MEEVGGLNILIGYCLIHFLIETNRYFFLDMNTYDKIDDVKEISSHFELPAGSSEICMCSFFSVIKDL